MTEGILVYFRPDGSSHCVEKFFVDYNHFCKWLKRYQLNKFESFEGLVQLISELDEYNYLCEVYRKNG